MTNKSLTLGVLAAALALAGGEANAADVDTSLLVRTAMPCAFQYTLAEVMASGFACQEGDKVFQRFNNSITPGVPQNFRSVPLETLVRFFDVPGDGVGIQFLVPPDLTPAQTAANGLFPYGGFPRGSPVIGNLAYNVAVSLNPTQGATFTRASVLVEGIVVPSAGSSSLAVSVQRVAIETDNATSIPTITAHGALTPEGPVGDGGGFLGTALVGGPTALEVDNRPSFNPPTITINSITNWWCESPNVADCEATAEGNGNGNEHARPPTGPTNGVPEPPSLALFGLGLAALALSAMRRRSGRRRS